MAAKLWIGTALTPHGNEYGMVAVVAETREEALAKAGAKLELPQGNYVRTSATHRPCSTTSAGCAR